MFKFSRNSLFTISLAVLSILLYIGVIHWGVYLTKHMVECFTVDREDPSTNHTVNLPINTTTSCENMCGPTAICSKTGEQCSSDIDCTGCQPPIPPEKMLTQEVLGYNDSGKLTNGIVPNFPALTRDIGTQAGVYTQYAKVPEYKVGYNTWRKVFDDGTLIFNQKYRPEPSELKKANAPQYQERQTLSGQFMDIGPLPANAEM